MGQTLVDELLAKGASRQSLYAQWLDLTVDERTVRGLPATQAALADCYGWTSDRQLRKYKDAPSFGALVVQYQGRKNPLRNLPPAPQTLAAEGSTPSAPSMPLDTSDLDDLDLEDLDASDEELDLRTIWYEKAKTDPAAAKFFWTAWGKAEQEQAAKAAEVRFDQYELSDLVTEALIALDPERVGAWMADHGWKVTRDE